MLTQILTFVLCYLAGSVPMAYIIVKLRHDKDITLEGSGNVGTLNAFVVSKSKRVGAAVLLLDFLKGFVPLYLMLFVFKIDYSTAAYGTVFIVAGHNYPVWLKFRGGRGLAPGAGIFALLNYFVLAMWCIVFLLGKLFKRDVLISNTAATLSILLSVFLITRFSFLVVDYSISSFSMSSFVIASLLVCGVVLSKHLEAFKSLFNNKTK